MNIASVILKLCGLGFVIAAAGLWAGAGMDSRPKNRDEQTLVGGAIWSQTLIPIALIMSAIVDDRLDAFTHSYYLFAGWVLLSVTGTMLVVCESKKLKIRRRSRVSISLNMDPPQLRLSFDKVYFTIGVLMMLAALITIIITGVLAFGAYWTAKYLMRMSETETESAFGVQSTGGGVFLNNT